MASNKKPKKQQTERNNTEPSAATHTDTPPPTAAQLAAQNRGLQSHNRQLKRQIEELQQRLNAAAGTGIVETTTTGAGIGIPAASGTGAMPVDPGAVCFSNICSSLLSLQGNPEDQFLAWHYAGQKYGLVERLTEHWRGRTGAGTAGAAAAYGAAGGGGGDATLLREGPLGPEMQQQRASAAAAHAGNNMPGGPGQI